MNNNHKEYYKYLKNRSFSGYIYRNFFLYPILSSKVDGKVLDLGCGIGDFLKYRKNTVGVDVNGKLVEELKDKGYNVFHMDYDVLPFEDNEFDSIIFDNVLEHIKNPIPLLEEIYRVLNKNGKLLIGVPGSYGYKKDSDHKCFYDEKKLKERLESNSFTSTSFFYTPFKSNFLNKNLSPYCLYGLFKKK